MCRQCGVTSQKHFWKHLQKHESLHWFNKNPHPPTTPRILEILVPRPFIATSQILFHLVVQYIVTRIIFLHCIVARISWSLPLAIIIAIHFTWVSGRIPVPCDCSFEATPFTTHNLLANDSLGVPVPDPHFWCGWGEAGMAEASAGKEAVSFKGNNVFLFYPAYISESI